MPRHSRGCRNCVHRHILCDGSYPTCKNCQTRELKCNGPVAGLRFRHVTGQAGLVTGKRNAFSRSVTREPGISSGAATWESAPPTLNTAQIGNISFATYFGLLISTTGHQERIWLQYCLRDPHNHPIASLAIEALSMAKFAKVYKQPRLITSAAQTYAKAIVALQCALNQVDHHSFDRLAAVTAMSHYELLICTAKRGWVQHAGGASKMMELIGPSLFNQHPYKAILNSSRFRIMHEAYYHRKPTFLRQENWQLARNPMSDSEVHFHKLQDLYGALSEIAAGANSVDYDNEHQIRRKQAVLDLVSNFIQDLDSWAKQWRAVRDMVPHLIPNDPKDTFYSDSDGLVFAESFNYPTIEDAIAMNMCMTMKLAALDWQRKLRSSSWWLGLADESAANIPEVQSIANDICRGFHLHFDSRRIVSGVHFLIYTAINAHKTFPRDSREVRWLQALLMRIADLTGYEVPRSWITCYENGWKF